jgi:CubicO group peptidase (beta-lactamase class C family)
MKIRSFVLILAVLALTCLEAAAAALPRSTPEAQGVSSAAIQRFVESAARDLDSLHSLIVVRHGQVIAEGWWSPYAAGTRHEMYSLSKSFTSTAAGLAIAEGKLSLDDTVLSFFPDQAPAEPSANLKSMRVRDLLCMSAGHEKEVSSSRELMTVKAFLAHPVPFKPGTRFLYNTPATFMVSAIVQKVTGQTLLDYLRTRLFEPLSIESPTWDTNVEGISLGGYGLSIRTEDIAAFGQLYLQKGQWQGKQLLPASWVELATSRQTSNGSSPDSDWEQGYGYQFWRSRHGYRGDGAFGQYCMVLPEQDTVIAITSGIGNMASVMNLIWDQLLPALGPSALAADNDAVAKLKSKLGSLTLRTAPGKATTPLAAKVAGKRFVFPANDAKIESLTLTSTPDGGAAVKVSVDGREELIPLGHERWQTTRGRLWLPKEVPLAGNGAWSSDDTFTVRLCAFETPYVVTAKLRFADDQLTFDRETNVGFGATKPPSLVGRIQ